MKFRHIFAGSIAFASLLAIGSFTKVTSAREYPLVEHVDGRPENFQEGDVACYGIWHNEDEPGWHVNVTTGGKRRHFKGRIWCEGGGHFKDIHQWKSEGERDEEAEHHNWFHKNIRRRPEEDPTEISFDVVTEDEKESGITFEVEGQGPLLWELGIGEGRDNEEVERHPRHTKIGRKGHHPPEIPFRTFAHPEKGDHGHD